MPGRIMQGRPEGGGSFGNGLLHSRPLPRRRMNQRPQAFPTLLHGTDSRQHHNPPVLCAVATSNSIILHPPKLCPHSCSTLKRFAIDIVAV
jgi:hypothetical protein